MTKIKEIFGREILDSRGIPTVEVDAILDDGSFGRASVPSGASVGSHEAIEIRDDDKSRFFGKGTMNAVKAVNTEISEALVGMDAKLQNKIDKRIIGLDGTPNKSRLGANATLGVSLAVAKAAAKSHAMSLYHFVGGYEATVLPVPMMNIINGGKHANNSVDIQEFMIMPVSANNFKEACQIGSEVYQKLKQILETKGYSTAVGDEGGFAPDLTSTTETLDLIMGAIDRSGLKPGKDVFLSIDCASTEYFDGNYYLISGQNLKLDMEENILFLKDLVDNYPILSIEDGMSENDWIGWKKLTEELGEKCQLVGDDLFVTNCNRLEKGIKSKTANSILIKPNQIGSLTETINTIELAKKANYSVIVSHRSGETEDTTIADLSVATNCGQIKTGSMSRTDRICKYNQLIRIEEELGSKASYYGKKVLGHISKEFTLSN